MSIGLIKTLSWASFIIAVIFLLVAIIVFFAFDIPNVYGEVTGKTAEKAIKAIRESGGTAAVKAKKSTVSMSSSGSILTSTRELKEESTSALSQTTMLPDPMAGTTILNPPPDMHIADTSILPDISLSARTDHDLCARNENFKFYLVEELSFIPSTEIIE